MSPSARRFAPRPFARAPLPPPPALLYSPKLPLLSPSLHPHPPSNPPPRPLPPEIPNLPPNNLPRRSYPSNPPPSPPNIPIPNIPLHGLLKAPKTPPILPRNPSHLVLRSFPHPLRYPLAFPSRQRINALANVAGIGHRDGC